MSSSHSLFWPVLSAAVLVPPHLPRLYPFWCPGYTPPPFAPSSHGSKDSCALFPDLKLALHLLELGGNGLLGQLGVSEVDKIDCLPPGLHIVSMCA